MHESRAVKDKVFMNSFGMVDYGAKGTLYDKYRLNIYRKIEERNFS